jgi:hypothetical protein
MSVAKHRLAAVSILVTGVVILVAWGRSQANETAAIRTIRDQFQGRWVATLIDAGDHRKVEGPMASSCGIEFDGKSVLFRQMIGGSDARGTYLIQRRNDSARIDLKLDAGWQIGIFEVGPDRLALAVNALALPERLAAPSRGRPTYFGGGKGQHLYVFRRAMPGE